MAVTSCQADFSSCAIEVYSTNLVNNSTLVVLGGASVGAPAFDSLGQVVFVGILGSSSGALSISSVSYMVPISVPLLMQYDVGTGSVSVQAVNVPSANLCTGACSWQVFPPTDWTVQEVATTKWQTRSLQDGTNGLARAHR